MSRSFIQAQHQPTIEQSPRKFKRHYNKKVRQKTKKKLNDFITSEQNLIEELEELEEDNLW